MPPHAPLSARDGRVRSAPTQGGESYYYSNQDIGLLHQIVTLGQELLPTLPKREQLPTTALFRAADVVFPQYGISPDGEDKYSRIIFLVGGLRTTDDLFERFRTVLAQMGIEIEYVESDGEQGGIQENLPAEPVLPVRPVRQEPVPVTPRSAARVHFDISASTDDDTTEPPRRVPPPVASAPAPPLRGGLRRNNSDSTALDQQQQQQQQHRQRQPFLHRRRRSEPVAPPRRQEESVQPPRPATAMGHWPEEDEDEEDPETDNDEGEDHAEDEDEEEGEDEDEDEDEDDQDDRDQDDQDQDDQDDRDDQEQDQDDQDQDDQGDEDDHEDQGDQEDNDMEDDHSEDDKVDQYTRSLELLGAPKISHGDTQDMFRDIPIRPRDPPSPSSGQSSSQATFTGLPGASDTLIQDELEYGPPPKVDLHIMAKVADVFFMRFAYQRGQSVQQWWEMCLHCLAQRQYAVEIDRELSLSEAVVVWSEVVVEQRMQREQEAEVEIEEVEEVEEEEEEDEEEEDEDEDEEGEDEGNATEDVLEQRDRAMKVAARAYNIALLDKAFTHWQAMAVDEAERTHVARRHLLRRKVFGAWRDQTVQDEATVRALVLGRAVRQWQTATAGVLGNRGWTLAEAVDEHELLVVGLFTWLRVYQERTAVAIEAYRLQTRATEQWGMQAREAGVLLAKAERRARRHLLGLAVDHWVEQAETQAAIRLRIEMEEDETFARAALQDLQKQAFAARQLRHMEAATALAFKETAVAVWRQQTAAAHRQRVKLAQQELRDWALHWVRERRLVQLRADQALDLKADAVQSWMLAEKLMFLLRYRDEQRVRRACLGLWEATVDEAEQARAADVLRCRLMAQFAVATLQRQRKVHAATTAMADGLADGTRAATALDALATATQDQQDYVADMEDMADRGAYYVAVTGALDGWGGYARRVREARLRATYHGLRRGVKRRTAAACVRVWRQAALPALGEMAATAVEFEMACDTDRVVGALDNWIRAAHDSLVRTTLAADADVEAYLSGWRLRQASHAAATAAAAEHDVATRLAARWDVWELQAAVQAQARAHTAAVLREKNERRLLRRVVGVWQEQLREQDDEEAEDNEANEAEEERRRMPLAATLPIRSHWSLSSATPTATAWRLGSSSVQSSTAATTPFSSAVLSKRDDDYYPAASFLVPIQETDLPGGKTPTKAPTQTPRPWPSQQHLNLNLKHTLRTTSMIGTPASTRLRQRLLAASRLADSVQLGPMSEFDEHEGERERPDDDDDDDDDGTSSSADAHPRLSAAARHRTRPLASSTRPAGIRSMMATTTPAGPLPSPFERRLRAAYRSTMDGGPDDHSSSSSRTKERNLWRRPDTTTTPMPSRLAGTVAFAYDED